MKGKKKWIEYKYIHTAAAIQSPSVNLQIEREHLIETRPIASSGSSSYTQSKGIAFK